MRKALFIAALWALTMCSGRLLPAEAAEIRDTVSREEIDQLKARVAELEKKVEAGTPPAPTAGPGGMVEPGYIFGEYWDDGLHAVSRDGRFDVRFGGRIHLDGAFIQAGRELRAAVPEIESGWEIRHPRIYLKGMVFGDFLYKLEYTFSDDTVGDAFLGATAIPYLGTVIIGKAARAFGNDPGPSSNYTLFMEYANTIIFGAGKQVGIAAGGPVLDRRVSWALQLFQYADGKGLRTEDGYNLNARLTGLPWYEDKGKEMMHLGLSYSYLSSKDEFRYRAGPEIHLAPDFVDTGSFPITNANSFCGETAWVKGPFALEGEYYGSVVDQEEGPGRTYFQGFYAQASCFLTGESRGSQYQTGYGEFDAPVHPHHPLDFEKGGGGAWQLAARYSYLDLNDDNIRGGVLGDLTLGLNWYLNPNLRWMLNYVHSHLNGAGSAEIVATRFAINI